MHPMHHPLFIQFLAYFNGNQDYFECHEVLEEYWKYVAPRDKLHPLTGWIQLATGLYHYRRGNYKGADTILKKAELTLRTSLHTPFFDDKEIDALSVIEHIHQTQKNVSLREPFKNWPVNIISISLKDSVEESISILPNLDDQFLQNKHMLRDRTDILRARNEKRRSRH